MYGSDENAAKDYPEQRGQPAPHDGNGRSDDGTCSSDCRKVMAEDYISFCRYEIVVIALFDAGHRLIGTQLKNPSGEELAVSVVSDDKSEKRCQSD